VVAGIWTDTESGKFCTLHDETFSRIGACPQCADDIGDDEPPPELVLPPGCLSLDALEARYVNLADLAEQHARDALDSDEWRVRALAPKLLDSALKALRQATVIAATREQEVLISRRMHEMKKLRRKAARH
jgi:hypothetical protein